MKKFFHKIHLWLSVPFGLIITLICFSGAALVFEKEVMELFCRDLYYVDKVGVEPLLVDQLAVKVSESLPDSVSVTGISIFSDQERAYQVNLSKPRRASVFVDQYTGEIKGRYERTPFFTFMFRMHRWLLDSMNPDGGVFVGKLVVGISTLMFVFVLISGIFIWIPRTKKALKNSLKIRAGKGWRRFWYDLHVAGGMYAVVFLLAMALTGLTWSFQWYRVGFYKVFGVEVQSNNAHGQSSANTASKERTENKGERTGGRGDMEKQKYAQFAKWDQVYKQLATDNPDYKQISVSAGSASVAFKHLGNQRASDRYSFNPRTGEITDVVLYKDADRSGKIRGWIYSVHVGSWGGMLTRILSFVAALLGASLPVTGYYLWIRKLVRKSRGKYQ